MPLLLSGKQALASVFSHRPPSSPPPSRRREPEGQGYGWVWEGRESVEQSLVIPYFLRPPAWGALLSHGWTPGFLNFAFSPPPHGRWGRGTGGLETRLGGPCTWLSLQGMGDFSMSPTVGVGLVPQVGLETLQPEGESGAGVESHSEGASPGTCTPVPRPLPQAHESQLH
uniref:Uncharacterized protein n=1 Tax=Castor canadensis TaxID=51338 RepID=A0A8C0W4S0_CASCN